MSPDFTERPELRTNGTTPASSANHQIHPRLDFARCPSHRGIEDSLWLVVTIISISPITAFGIHKLAIGMNHAPVAQPCDHRRFPGHLCADDVCALLVHTMRSTMTTSHNVTNNDVAEASASSWSRQRCSRMRRCAVGSARAA